MWNLSNKIHEIQNKQNVKIRLKTPGEPTRYRWIKSECAEVSLLVFLCSMTDIFNGKAERQGKCNTFPYRLVGCRYQGHNKAK